MTLVEWYVRKQKELSDFLNEKSSEDLNLTENDWDSYFKNWNDPFLEQ